MLCFVVFLQGMCQSPRWRGILGLWKVSKTQKKTTKIETLISYQSCLFTLVLFNQWNCRFFYCCAFLHIFLSKLRVYQWVCFFGRRFKLFFFEFLKLRHFPSQVCALFFTGKWLFVSIIFKFEKSRSKSEELRFLNQRTLLRVCFKTLIFKSEKLEFELWEGEMHIWEMRFEDEILKCR